MAKTKTFAQGKEGVILAAVSALGLVFFGYACLRAARVAITFDEVITLYYYVKKGFLALFKFDASNNHFLNTVLVWAVSRVGGTSEFVLRLPSLAGYFLYLIFSFRLLKRYTPPVVAVSGFILLNANPYLQDFFALCRGYGLSLGLLMAALFYLVRFGDEARDSSPGASRTLTKGLAAAAASVLANFTMLIVYLGIVAVAGIAIIVYGRHRFIAAGSNAAPRRPRRYVFFAGAWAIVAFLVTLQVVLRGYVTSPKMFETVTVTLDGLAPAEHPSVEVLGLDLFKNYIRLVPANGGWASEAPAAMTGLVLKIPRELLDEITDVRVQIGRYGFRERDRILQARSAPRTESVVEITLHDHVSLPPPDFDEIAGVLNWKGRAAYNHLVRLSLTVYGILFGGLISLGILAARLARKYRLLNVEPFFPLGRVSLALAAVVAVPIYFLRDKGEFVFVGGAGSRTAGEAVLSLVNNSIYGRRILGTSSLPWIAGAALLAAALFAAGILAKREKGLGPAQRAGAVASSVLGFALLAVLAQRLFFGISFLNGRRALAFIPLALLFVIFAFASADTVRGLRRPTRVVLAGLTVLVAVHFAKTANASFTFDWRQDADHKAVLADLEDIRRARPPAEADIHLGLDYNFYPGMVYLKDRRNLAWLHLDVIPPERPEDFYYLSESFDPTSMILVKQYPTGNILVKKKY